MPPHPPPAEDDPFDQEAPPPARSRTADLSSRIIAKHQAMKAEKGTTARIAQGSSAGAAAPLVPPRPDQLFGIILAHDWVPEDRIEELRDFFYKKGVTQVLRRNGRVSTLLVERGLLSQEQADELDRTLADMGLFPRFRIVRIAGPGLAGRRYVAVDLSTGTDVRIEIFRQRDDALRATFREQAARLERVRNRRLVPLIGWGEHGEACLVATPLPEGTSLVRLIAERQIGSEVLAARIALQIAEGLAYTYVTAGICHGALTPSSIQVIQAGPSLCVSLGDFGLSDHLLPGVLPEGWHAPDAVRGRTPNDPGADIYTVGAIFYTLLGAGAGGSQGTDGTIDLSPFHPLTRDIVLRALAPERAQRYPDYRRLIAALATLLGQLGYIEPDEAPLPGAGQAGEGTMYVRRAREPGGQLRPLPDPPTARRDRREQDGWAG